jgi:hypothetical protein
MDDPRTASPTARRGERNMSDQHDDDDRDRVRKEYEEVKSRFRSVSFDAFKQGEWLASMIRWVLEEYAAKVDAEYIRRRYPGAGPSNQAERAIKLAVRACGWAGAASASAITALELASMGPQALITVPTVGLSLIGDVAYSTRTQLRTAYDLSVIHGAPLSTDDVEDCYILLMMGLGAKVGETVGVAAKVLGPHVVAYNVRRLLRIGLRKAIQEALKRIGGVWLARKLTERAMMRLLVPGVSIPISYVANRLFTKALLKTANRVMYQRGRVVRPIVSLFAGESTLPRAAVVKQLIAVAASGDTDHWTEGQMNALRYCQQALCMTDDECASMDGCFEQGADVIANECPRVSGTSVGHLAEALSVMAAFGDESHDDNYARTIEIFLRRQELVLRQDELLTRIRRIRKDVS